MRGGDGQDDRVMGSGRKGGQVMGSGAGGGAEQKSEEGGGGGGLGFVAAGVGCACVVSTGDEIRYRIRNLISYRD